MLTSALDGKNTTPCRSRGLALRQSVAEMQPHVLRKSHAGPRARVFTVDVWLLQLRAFKEPSLCRSRSWLSNDSMTRLRTTLTPRASTRSAAVSRLRFRALVKTFAGLPDWDMIHALRAQCKRQGHTLIGPKLQYRERTPDRGRYFVLVRMPLASLSARRNELLAR